MGMKKVEGFDISQFLKVLGTKEANEALESRLESLRSYLSQDEWKKGISIHLQALIGSMLQSWVLKKGDDPSEDFVRGYVSALIRIAALPITIEQQITFQAKQDDPKSKPGDAGY